MKREILFRGKRIDSGEWIEGSLLVNKFNTYIIPMYDEFIDYYKPISVDSETIGQFTGLTDKKCGKIFSGDVLQWVSCNPFSLGEIRRVVVNYINGWYFCVGSISVSLAKLLAAERCEFIGNIHDNPELLK